MDSITIHRRSYGVSIHPDDCSDTPWEREDGHGPVTDWTRRAKRPGELLLTKARHGECRYYDFAAAVQIARRDGWRVQSEHTEDRPGRIAAEAARADYERLRRWCAAEWGYVGMVVRDPRSGETASLWGIESDAEGYLATVAAELAAELAEARKRVPAQRARAASQFATFGKRALHR